MKHFDFNLRTLFLVLLLSVGFSAWAQDATWVAKDATDNPGNAGLWTSSTIDEFSSWTATKGGSNDPKYYDNGEGLRVYNGGTFTVTSTKTIDAIQLTFSGSNTFSTSNKSSVQKYSSVNATSKEWDVSQVCRLQKVEIWYEGSTSVQTVNVYASATNGTFTVDGKTPTASSPVAVEQNSTVDIVATANEGYVFSGWSVNQDATIDNPLNASAKLTLGVRNCTVTASFILAPEMTATATASNGTDAVTVDLGAEETLTCAVENGTAAAYQWYSNSTNSTTSGVAVEGAESATYKVPTDKVGTTYYYCYVLDEDANEATSNAVAVTVEGPAAMCAITWNVNGKTSTTEQKQGAAIEYPEAPSVENYEFVGWTAANAVNADGTEIVYLASDATVPAEAAATYYAVFAKVNGQDNAEMEITITNFDEITTSYTKTYTHQYDQATVEAYGVYNNTKGIQMNSGKGTYIKNTTAMPGAITNITLTWATSGKNSVTMYMDKDAVATTSSYNAGKQSGSVTEQSLDFDAADGYKFFYLDGTTVTGACYLSSMKLTYLVKAYSDYTLTPDSVHTGIGDLVVTPAGNGKMFNVLGQEVTENYKGIVIKDGKKFINK